MVEKRVVISRDEIAQRVKELGGTLTKIYSGRQLVVVGILNGAFIFVADLVREIELPLSIDFVRVASYGSETYSSGELRFTKDIELAVEGKDILLVEDIVDTGRTIATLKDYFLSKNPGSFRVCALIDKKERREVDVTVDYIGFEVREGFLVGYGLDCAEKYRNCPEVYCLPDSSK